MNFQLLNNFEAILEDKNLSDEWQKMEEAFRKIIEKKGLSIQTALEIIIKNYILENLDCILNSK